MPPDYAQIHFDRHPPPPGSRPRPRAACVDGTLISIQQGPHYSCDEDTFEIWDFSEAGPRNYVTRDQVNQIIQDHGGLV